jgi:hypothetical protein
MLVATYCSPSHADMANRFVLGTMHRAGFGGVVVYADEDQVCPSGVFESLGFRAAAAEKLRFLSGMPCDGRPMLFVDADVVMFPNLAVWCSQMLEDKPSNWIGLQDDIKQWCTGVLLFRRTPAVLDWFRFVYQVCVFADLNDQDGWHSLRMSAKNWPVECEVLPHNVVSNYASVTGGQSIWNGENFAVPEGCLLWHANWCVGVERKTRMLEYVMASETSRVATASG